MLVNVGVVKVAPEASELPPELAAYQFTVPLQLVAVNVAVLPLTIFELLTVGAAGKLHALTVIVPLPLLVLSEQALVHDA